MNNTLPARERCQTQRELDLCRDSGIRQEVHDSTKRSSFTDRVVFRVPVTSFNATERCLKLLGLVADGR